MKNPTKREKFELLRTIPGVQENAMLMEFIQHELDLLARKNSGERKMTVTQVVNEGIKAEILSFLGKGGQHTVTGLIKNCPACADLSNQRVSALLRQMVPDEVCKLTIKRKSYFCLPEFADIEEVGE